MAAGTLASGGARASDDVRTCAHDAEVAQELMKAAKLTEARTHLLVCATEVCPSMIRKDCADWLAQVEASLPTVLIDGRIATESFDGTAIAVDPGVHRFRFEVRDGPSAEQTLMIREGEKNRIVPVVFADASQVTSEAPALLPPSPGVHVYRGSKPVGAYVATVVGALSLGTFAVAGIKGVSDYETLIPVCRGNCSDSQTNTVRTEFRVADIALLVAVLSGSLATYLFLSHHAHAQSTLLGPWRSALTF
jgi:hypothetical protein